MRSGHFVAVLLVHGRLFVSEVVNVTAAIAGMAEDSPVSGAVVQDRSGRVAIVVPGATDFLALWLKPERLKLSIEHVAVECILISGHLVNALAACAARTSA